MQTHIVRVQKPGVAVPREDQLAWKIAAFATGQRPLDDDAAKMISCRIVDNASVALASVNREPVVAARAQALAHPRAGGATLFGVPSAARVHAEWAAWANGVAVRELDYHDTFLAADYSHPGDSIPPLLAVAQQCGLDGAALSRGIAVAYEIHVALVKSISLHKHKKDHVAHLVPAMIGGLGAMLRLDTETVYQAINQGVHLAFSTRQSRKGEISSWKAFVPGFGGKTAIEAVDRAMRGEKAPSPIYEGEDSVIAWMLDGPSAEYSVSLPEKDEPARGILDTYTKAHSAEYQAQALIDLCIDLDDDIDFKNVQDVLLRTSHHTHNVIGTGSNDPEKMDPNASRETLDHSITYILAVALEDRRWHHVDSYTRARATRPSTVALWQKIRTEEDKRWTDLYHEPDPAKRAFGGEIVITLEDSTAIRAEKAVADAHPNGASPWKWENYLGKFKSLSAQVVTEATTSSFIELAERVTTASASDLLVLNPTVSVTLEENTARGIFDQPRADQA